MSLPQCYRAFCIPQSCTTLFLITLLERWLRSRPIALCQGRPDDITGKVAHAGNHLQSFSSTSASPSPPPRKNKKKSHHSKRSADSVQMEKIWAAVSHQGDMTTPNTSIKTQHTNGIESYGLGNDIRIFLSLGILLVLSVIVGEDFRSRQRKHNGDDTNGQ